MHFNVVSNARGLAIIYDATPNTMVIGVAQHPEWGVYAALTISYASGARHEFALLFSRLVQSCGQGPTVYHDEDSVHVIWRLPSEMMGKVVSACDSRPAMDKLLRAGGNIAGVYLVSTADADAVGWSAFLERYKRDGRFRVNIVAPDSDPQDLTGLIWSGEGTQLQLRSPSSDDF